MVTFSDKLNQEITRLENVVNRPFDSTQRLRVSRITDFRNAMISRVETREDAMISKANELFQLWQTMTPREAFMSMSNPPSEEEMTAWYMFVDTFYHSWTPEERQLIGGNQIYGGAWRILVGLGAIAMTKGAAKPFVIAAWASGGASIIFGASHIVEGAHNLLLSWEWDIETQAFNPIRDTVFGGNQAVHDTTNFWASMFSMTFMCTGHAMPRHHKPIAFDVRVVNDISRRTGFTPSQIGDLIRYRGLTDKTILARLNKGQSIHRVLGVSPVFDSAKVNEIARRTGLASKQVEDILRNIDMTETEFLARLSRGHSIHQILRVTPFTDSSFNELNTAVDTIQLPDGTWNLGYSPRGFKIDEIVGNNLGSNFPVIDKIDGNGIVTSIKSMDLRLSYQKPTRLESAIRADIRKVANFKGTQRPINGIDISADEITGRQLQIVVPNVKLTPSQVQEINNAIEYGRRQNVEVIITIGK